MATDTPNSRGKALRQLLSVGSKSKAIPSPGAEVRGAITRAAGYRILIATLRSVLPNAITCHDTAWWWSSCFIQAARTRFGWKSRRTSLATDGPHTTSPQAKGKTLFTSQDPHDASLVTSASYAEAATNTSPPPSPHEHELQYLQAQLDYWRARANESFRYTPRISHRTPSAHDLETPRYDIM